MIKEKIKLIKISKLKKDPKKYAAEFQIEKSSGKISKKTIKFGSAGMSDFTLHNDTDRRERYISRHKKDLKTGQPFRAGYLSMYILWNKKSFSASVADYKKRLNAYNRTGKFSTKITGSKLLNFGINQFGTPISDIPFEETTLKKLPSDIQRKIEKDVIKYNLDKKLSKMMLKNFLTKIRDENLIQKNLPLYKVLDIEDIKTIIFLKLANKILKKSDFTSNSLWAKVILNLLDKLNRTVLPLLSADSPMEVIDQVLDTISQLKLFFKEVFNLHFDFDEDRGVWYGGIYEKRNGYEFIEYVNDEEFIKLFITNNKFGTPVSNIPFKETSLKVLPDEIQHKIEREVFKKNMNLKNVDKIMLKNYLIKIKAENVNLRYVPLYRVLDEGDISTVIWLKLANKILKKSDFTINSLWTKIIINLLEEIDMLRPYENPRLNEHEFGIIEATINQIELLLMSKFNIYIDFESERGDWAEIAKTELKEKINEDNYEQNYFGTKEGKKISFSDSKTIKMFEVDKLGKHKASGSGKPHIINAKLKELDKNDRQCILNFVIYVVEVVFKDDKKKTVLNFLQNDKYIETVTDRVFSDPNYIKMFPKCKVPEYYETWLNSNPQLLSFFVNKYYKNRKLAFGIPKKKNVKSELSKIPDNVVNKQMYLRIKNKIKKEIGTKRRWGAYDSGRLVREYKAKGGKYSEKKKSSNKSNKSNKSSDLSRWYKEKWIDACAKKKKKSCGRTKETIKNKVTYCRPSIRVNKNTPKTVQELSKATIIKRCKK